MKVIDFVNLVSNGPSENMVRTRNRSSFEFVVNPSDHAPSDTDTCVSFDGGVSVKGLIRYVTLHNLEAYNMYQSSHHSLDYGDIGVFEMEVVVL